LKNQLYSLLHVFHFSPLLLWDVKGNEALPVEGHLVEDAPVEAAGLALLADSLDGRLLGEVAATVIPYMQQSSSS